jgi:DNA-binding NtrC family response regulator
VLDKGEIRPVGATRSFQVNARVVAATNAELRERIKAGRFLEDLYYRMNDIAITVPPLRDRREDIPALTEHFLATTRARWTSRCRRLAPAVTRALLNHEWRGNVRELEKTVKRLVVLAEPDTIAGTDLLPEDMRAPIETLPIEAAAASTCASTSSASSAA